MEEREKNHAKRVPWTTIVVFVGAIAAMIASMGIDLVRHRDRAMVKAACYAARGADCAALP